MSYLITNLCSRICVMECLDVCPNQAIKSVKADISRSCRHGIMHRRLYIDKEKCNDCGECEMICPSKAIFHETDIPNNKHIKVHHEDLEDNEE